MLQASALHLPCFLSSTHGACGFVFMFLVLEIPKLAVYHMDSFWACVSEWVVYSGPAPWSFGPARFGLY